MPEVMRWPGKIPAGMVSNEIVSHLDWLPTLLAAAGEPDIKEKLKKGYKAEDKTFKVHLDGYNLLPYLTGKEEKSPRIGFFYFSDDGDLVAPGMTTGKWSLWSSALPVHYRYPGSSRYDNWKMVFMEQRATGTLQVWAEPFVPLRIPKIFNLRTDPYERADQTSNTYYDWLLDHAFLLVPSGCCGRFSGDIQRISSTPESGKLYS
ncbi:alkaline phosphatase family protein [Methanosarcina barkeri]|uniref:hypothetical protein n=1 Tax=Methanosarcina barkeri TaxID=2208 RepID=UPI000A885B01